MQIKQLTRMLEAGNVIMRLRIATLRTIKIALNDRKRWGWRRNDWSEKWGWRRDENRIEGEFVLKIGCSFSKFSYIHRPTRPWAGQWPPQPMGGGDCSWCFPETLHIVVCEKPRAASGAHSILTQDRGKVWVSTPRIEKKNTSLSTSYFSQI